MKELQFLSWGINAGLKFLVAILVDSIQVLKSGPQ